MKNCRAKLKKGRGMGRYLLITRMTADSVYGRRFVRTKRLSSEASLYAPTGRVIRVDRRDVEKIVCLRPLGKKAKG